jgi:hypothetical protein
MAWQDPPPPPRACEVCGQLFTVSPMARNPRYCGRECQITASTAIRTERRRVRREQAEITPDIRELPPVPWLVREAGLCSDPKTLAKTGHVWTSDDRAERDLAKAICRSCSVQDLCLQWSLALPASDDTIYGGAGRFTRNRLRRERRPAQPAVQQPGAAPRETASA